MARLYDAFGNVDSSSRSWTGAFGYGGPYGYQSASEGGLMLLGHRYYDPSTGRFLTRDPVKDGRKSFRKTLSSTSALCQEANHMAGGT